MAQFRTKARAVELLGKGQMQIYLLQSQSCGKMAMMHMLIN